MVATLSFSLFFGIMTHATFSRGDSVRSYGDWRQSEPHHACFAGSAGEEPCSLHYTQRFVGEVVWLEWMTHKKNCSRTHTRDPLPRMFNYASRTPCGEGKWTLWFTVSKGDWKHKKMWLREQRSWETATSGICRRCYAGKHGAWTDVIFCHGWYDDPTAISTAFGDIPFHGALLFHAVCSILLFISTTCM